VASTVDPPAPSQHRLIEALPGEAAHDEPPVFRRSAVTRVLDWLDARGPLQFFALLYIARWVVIVPMAALSHRFLDTSDQERVWEWLTAKDAAALAFHLLLRSPLIETLIECVLPYLIITRIQKRWVRRPWGFIVASGFVMALMHPMLFALPFAFVTGVFLAYCYAHFAIHSTWRAFAATAAFHAAINVVGLTMILAGL
jgi:hypothetical protein